MVLDHEYERARFVVGEGVVDRLSDLVDEHDRERVMVVAGKTTGTKPELIDPVVEGLGDKHVYTYTGAREDAPLEAVLEGIELKREHGADALVSLGGGSNHDTAKSIAELDAEEGKGIHDVKAQATDDGDVHIPELSAEKDPIFAVSTTLSAGEVTNAFGCTDEEKGEKTVTIDEEIRSTANIYDPNLTSTTPEDLFAETAMNALDHAVEIMYSKTLGDNEFYQATAAKSISLLMENVPDAVDDMNDFEAVEKAQIGAGMSAMDVIQGYCINHGINHDLCARHPVHHGQGNSILLPHGIRFNFEAVPERVVRIAEAMGVNTDTMSDEEALEATIDRIREFQKEIGVPYRLRDVGVDKDDFRDLAELAVHDPGMANNPRKVTADDIEEILNAAW